MVDFKPTVATIALTQVYNEVKIGDSWGGAFVIRAVPELPGYKICYDKKEVNCRVCPEACVFNLNPNRKEA